MYLDFPPVVDVLRSLLLCFSERVDVEAERVWTRDYAVEELELETLVRRRLIEELLQ
jgi:hypothetical protein